MQEPMERDFINIVTMTKGLGIAGLFSDESYERYNVNPAKNQKLRLDRFQEFRLCWKELLKSQECQIRQDSPSSYLLHRLIEQRTGENLSFGAVIAAVIYLGLPYQHITNTPDVRIGISRQSPIFQK